MEVLYALIAGGVGGAVIAAVVSLLVLRHVPKDADVDELVRAVESEVKERRRERMRAVRRAETENPAITPPKELRGQVAPLDNAALKQQLRQRVFAARQVGGSSNESV